MPARLRLQHQLPIYSAIVSRGMVAAAQGERQGFSKSARSLYQRRVDECHCSSSSSSMIKNAREPAQERGSLLT